MVVCEDEDHELQKELFLQEAQLNASKLITCLSLQKGWNVTHIDCEEAFPNGCLNRPVLAKLS